MKENVSFNIDKLTKEKMLQHYASYQNEIKGDYIIFSASLNPSLTLIIYSSKKGYKAYFSGENALQEARLWDKEVKIKHSNKEAAKEVGALIAKRALEKNIKEVVFDRGGYIYHGVVKELAEAAREGGLTF